MQTALKLPSYEEFGRLRLRPFCPADKRYKTENVNLSRGRVFWESINNVVFQRWSEFPEETARINLGFQGEAANGLPRSITIAPAVLEVLGLELAAGISYEETVSRLGAQPRWRSKYGHFAIFHIGEESVYEVNCGFMAGDRNLDRVRIHRLDIKMPPEE